MMLKTVAERIATIARAPRLGVRADQVLATAWAFDKLIHETGGGGASSANLSSYMINSCAAKSRSDSSS